MYFVSWAAVRARTDSALSVLILAVLAATAAAAGPWYGLTVASRAAGAEVAARDAAERVVTVHQSDVDFAGDPRGALDRLASRVQQLLPLPGATPALGLTADTQHADAQGTTGLPLAYRDGFCAHARLTGACPDQPGTAAISADTARRLGLRPGATLVVRAGDDVRLRITGVYETTGGTYWTDRLFRSHGDLDPAFTSLETFRMPQLSGPATLGCTLAVPLPLLRGDRLYDLNGVLNAAGDRFAAAQLDLDNGTGGLFDAVRADRVTVLQGVLVPLGLFLVLAWFALALAGRLTGRDRREDAGLLKLRGSTGGRALRLAAGQHVPPLAAGTVLGLAAGIAAAGLIGGAPVPGERWLAAGLSLAAAAAAGVGGLLVLTAGDALAQRAPVAALLRRVPGARRDWRSRFVDLALAGLAAGAVYQARTGGPRSGLGVAAPALVALAVGLLAARLLRALADRAGGVAVRAGRLRSGLTAVQLSRQPGTDRVFALLVVAVALLALTIGGFAAGRQERAARAGVELGAARVLTVTAQSRTQLLYAVRRADPGGRHAMAAVLDTNAAPPVLAVDSERLAAVAAWRPEYGPIGALPAAARLPAALPLITGGTLVVRVHRAPDGPALLGAVLQQEGTGAGVRVEFRGLRPGDQEATAPVPACATAPGCRLVGWQLFTGAPGALTVSALAQRDPAATILDTAGLADVARWHGDYATVAARYTGSAAGLTLAVDGDSGTRVDLVDAPLPLPVVLAGPAPAGWRFDDAMSARFGGTVTPVRVVGGAPVLPVLGRTGILTDLDAARRLAGDADLGGTFQVWLAPATPPAVLDALRATGLTVLDDRSTAARAAALAATGAVITAPFDLFTAAMAVLVAAAMVYVATTAGREPRASLLQALRAQGLARDTAVTAGYAGTAVLVPAGVAGGVLAAVAARPIAAVTAPAFTDGWRVVAPPGVLGAAPLAVAAAAGLVTFGLAGWLALRGLRGSVR
ncbi:ABC transporter permease [Actinoplanes sp. KI2]|uniref:FtsX-like permease family protein n=1 Tax=Actinoplanes sp. KI2 TaxID=2983315 RepID=UPI0021D5ACB1|nr:FtsX-like permease family protein [Actinoplanes sp. KI2]MCU7722555.1 ABC transporter permease [Actinoplanes sp. KI2]